MQLGSVRDIVACLDACDPLIDPSQQLRARAFVEEVDQTDFLLCEDLLDVGAGKAATRIEDPLAITLTE